MSEQDEIKQFVANWVASHKPSNVAVIMGSVLGESVNLLAFDNVVFEVSDECLTALCSSVSEGFEKRKESE